MVKNMVRTSATGIVSHTPFTPKTMGNKKSVVIKNTIPRNKAMIVECLALLKDVKNMLAKEFMPMKI